MHSGLGVAPLGRRAEPVDDLALRSASSAVRSRTRSSSTSLSRVDAVPDAALGQLAPGDRADAPTSERQSGAVTARIVPAPEEELRAGERKAAPARTVTAPTAPSGEAPARQRREHARRASSSDVDAEPERSAAASPFSAVQIALAWTSGPGMSSSPPTRRRVDVLQRRRGRPDHHDLAADQPRARGRRATSENETVGIVPGGPR